MSTLEQLENKARERRRSFAATLLQVRERMNPAALADEAIGIIDPKSTFVRRIAETVKENPMVAASLVAGTGFLLKQAMNGTGEDGIKPKRVPKRIRSKRPPTQTKENET